MADPSTDGGFLSQLQGIFSSVAGVAKPVGAIAQAAGTVAGLIPKANNSKLGATNAQENIQNVAFDVDRRLKAGEIDPDTALSILAGLDAQAQKMESAGNMDYLRGGQTAALIIQNVKSNALQMKTANSSTPIDPSKGLTGSANAQVAQFGTAIRNRLINAPQGDVLKGTPVDTLLTAPPSPIDRFSSAADTVNSNFPPPDTTSFIDRLRSKLDAPAAPPVRY